MAWQTYDPKTGKTTTYTGNTNATKGAVVSVSGGVNKPVIQKETMIKPAPTQIGGGNLTEKTVTKNPVVSEYQYGADVLDKKANNAAVNTLYNSYIGRDAFDKELTNWGVKGGADTTVRALETFLKDERKKYKITDPIKPIGTVKSEYENISSGGEDIVSETIGSGETVDVTVTDPVNTLENKVVSLQTQLDTLKADQLESYEKRKVEAEAKMAESKAEIKRLQDLQKAEIDKANPENQDFYDQETRILQNQLDAAELASSKLGEDYEKARALTEELNELNEQANSDIQTMKKQTGLSSLLNPRINKTIDDYTGRASVLQAAMAGVNNNINLSYQYIDKAQEDLTARKNEEINYYNSVISFYEKLEVSEEKYETLAIADKAEAAQNIIDVKNAEIATIEATSTAIKELMLNDPTRAAGAGISLTDSIETITQKLADYDYSQEVINTRNSLEAEGYTYLSNMNGITSEEGITRITDSKGVERIYKNPPETETTASGGTWTIKDDADGNPTLKINNKTGEVVMLDGTAPTTDDEMDVGTDLLIDGKTGGQCGDFLHKIANNIPTMGDTFEEKMNMGNMSTNQYKVGDVLIQDVGTPYGHVSIVESVNGNEVTILESNYGLDEKVGRRTITMGDSSVKGVYRGAEPRTDLKQSPRTELTAIEMSQANKLAKDTYSAGAVKTKDGYANFVQPIIDRMLAGETIDDISDSMRMAGQSPEFTGYLRDAAQQITSDYTKKKTDDVFDKLDDIIDQDKPGAVKDYLKKAALDALPSATAGQVRGKERTVEFLSEIQDDLRTFEANGGNTNIFTGNTEKVAKMVGAVNDEELRKIATKINTAIQGYRRSMSGVAFSVPESEEYEAMFPNVDKTSNFNKANIEALTEVFDGDIEFIYSSVMGGDAYNEIFAKSMIESKTDVNSPDQEIDALRNKYNY